MKGAEHRGTKKTHQAVHGETDDQGEGVVVPGDPAET